MTAAQRKQARRLEQHRKPVPVHGAKQRQCMSCRRLFLSEGPHNRLCTQCRTKSSE